MILITSRRIEESKEIDIDKVRRDLQELVALTVKLSDILTKANTIRSNSDKIIDSATYLKTEFDTRLNDVIGRL